MSVKPIPDGSRAAANPASRNQYESLRPILAANFNPSYNQ